MRELAASQFARVLIALQPYVDEIAFVGGWVHALYLAEANDRGAVMTEDIDVTLPHTLLTRDRPALLKLARDAGLQNPRLCRGRLAHAIDIRRRSAASIASSANAASVRCVANRAEMRLVTRQAASALHR